MLKIFKKQHAVPKQQTYQQQQYPQQHLEHASHLDDGGDASQGQGPYTLRSQGDVDHEQSNLASYGRPPPVPLQGQDAAPNSHLTSSYSNPSYASQPDAARAFSPNGQRSAAGAYESYSEQHDVTVAPGKAGKGSSQGKSKGNVDGASGPAKLEKAKRGGGLLGAHSEGKITDKIAWLCGSPNSNVDWSYVLSLADSISSSEAAAKEAARAIRKELKYGEPEAQRRAIRMLAILMINASDRFRMQIATKRFLEVVEQVATGSKTDPTVAAKMLDVLAVLAYLYQADEDLGLITKCWNKIKPKDRPLNGEPLDSDSEDFNPPRQPSRAPLTLPPHRTMASNGSGVDQDAISNGHAQATGEETPRDRTGKSPGDTGFNTNGRRKGPRDYSHRIISPDEDMRKLHEECHIARTNAAVLIDSMTTSGLSSPLLEEFAHKVQVSQVFLVSQIDWASAQANRSREDADEQAAIALTEGRQSPRVAETREEALLADILSANERLMEAQQMLDDARRRQMEEDEEAAVRERSRKDTRMNRDTAATLDSHSRDEHGQPYGPSSSSSSGQRPAAAVAGSYGPAYAQRPPSPRLVAARLDSDGPVPQHARGPLPRTPQPIQPLAPASAQALTGSPAMQGSRSNGDAVASTVRPPDDDEDIHTPVVPSEKALGKRRAFSDRGDAFDPEVQARVLAASAEAQPVHVPVKLHEVLEQDDSV